MISDIRRLLNKSRKILGHVCVSFTFWLICIVWAKSVHTLVRRFDYLSEVLRCVMNFETNDMSGSVGITVFCFEIVLNPSLNR